jgi:peptide deformylase
MIPVMNMLLMKDIIQEKDPEQNRILRVRSVDVPVPLSPEDRDTLLKMMEYVLKSQVQITAETYGLRPAVGLSAPQIGLNRRLFCMSTTDENNEKLHQYAVANPKIIAFSEEKTYLGSGEGCLSVEESKNGLVPRSKRVKARVHLVDLNTGEERDAVLKLSGYPGIVFQHEYDHLQGILFIDRLVEALPGIQPVVFAEDEPEKEND